LLSHTTELTHWVQMTHDDVWGRVDIPFRVYT